MVKKSTDKVLLKTLKKRIKELRDKDHSEELLDMITKIEKKLDDSRN